MPKKARTSTHAPLYKNSASVLFVCVETMKTRTANADTKEAAKQLSVLGPGP